MDYEKLKEVIAKKIKENGREEITGPVLQMVLMAMVDSLGEVYPQTYTEEQKAQARANIDALSNHDGEITKEKLSIEVQAILNDVANKQNITDESLATIAKTIVGAINEVYKGGLKDASIGTSKIEDGAVTEDKLASSSVTNEKIADNTITEPKLDTALTAKVNNNVKTVEQTLTDDEVKIASKNLKFRDANGNFFADKVSYDEVTKLSVKPSKSIFGNHCYANTFISGSCENNTFGNHCISNTIKYGFISNELGPDCNYNTFGENFRGNKLRPYCSHNTFGNNCYRNILGPDCSYNTFGSYCSKNELGPDCSYNTLGSGLEKSKIEAGVSYVELRSKANGVKILQNIHILSGVIGTKDERLVINIPDEYLGSSRELIITTKRTDGGPSTPEDIVMYYADEVADKQNKQDTTLATTSKEVVGAINEIYNGGVKDKSIELGKLAQTIQDTLNMVDKLLGAGYQFAGVATIDTNPGTPDANVFYIANGKGTYTYFGGIEVTEDEVVILYYDTIWHKVSTGIASQVNLTKLAEKVDEKQDNIDSLSDDEKAALLVSLGLGKIGVVSQKQTWNDVGVEPAYVMSEKVKGFICQDNIDILISYGFVFNEETGYFELNGLTDISLQEALDIVAVGKPNFSLCDLHYAFKKIRTNLPIFDNQNYNTGYFGSGISNKIRMGAMAYHSDIEVFVYGQYKYYDNYKNSGFLYSTIEQGAMAFNNCYKLEKLSIIPGTSNRFYDTFTGCYRLKELELVYLMCDVNLGNSSLLSAKSIHIMIANAYNTNAITITLHSDAKARWESSEYYEEDSQTIITKNITIA